jgi:hypothetical protein
VRPPVVIAPDEGIEAGLLLGRSSPDKAFSNFSLITAASFLMTSQVSRSKAALVFTVEAVATAWWRVCRVRRNCPPRSTIASASYGT